MNHPPSGSKHTNPRFAGRDWRDIAIGELTSPDDIRWIDMDSSVEEATIVSAALAACSWRSRGSSPANSLLPM